MKLKVIFTSIIVMSVLAFSVYAESLDRFGIIDENTGSLSTITELDTPDLRPGQRIEVVVVARGLQAQWGEGQIHWRYRIIDEMGQAVAQSSPAPITHRTAESRWDLLRVESLALPRDLSDGRYRITWEIVDDHSDSIYMGNAPFTIGTPQRDRPATSRGPEPQSAPETPPAAAPQAEYIADVEGVEFTLTGITRNSNRMIVQITGVNKREEEVGLRLWGRDTRIIDGRGRELRWDDIDGSSDLTRGVGFPVGIPLQATIEFRGRAVSIDSIAMIEITFLNTNDVIAWRDITVPWP